MKNFTIFNLVTLTLIVAMLPSCAPTHSLTDDNFGKSVATLRAQQTIYPHGSPAHVPMLMDGTAARAAMNQYYQSFSAPAQHTNVFNIGMGGASP